ncbi:hypothetical protein [Actinotignum sp. GS-2025b]|uniref:hypothetical protein n=1 Tax=Actinotignum sp. GS-2025b TaxID=3427275 RepID=UPI003F45EEBB
MVNEYLNERADEFAAHLQLIGELLDPGFSVLKQAIIKGDPSTIRLSGSISADRFVTVRFDYKVFLSPDNGFLTVAESMFSVIRGVVGKEPLVRWDYIRSPHSNIPCAHIQIHSHGDEWTHALLSSGKHSRRSRRRTKKAARTPRIADIHLPVGGHRFRPCLEHVLLFVVDEFGVACTPQAREALHQGIREWKDIQLRAALRRNRASAVEALES